MESVSKNSQDASSSNINEKTDKKTKLKILQEMWEAAKSKKQESDKHKDENKQS